MNDDFDQKAELADTFLRAGNIDKAKDLCREILEKDPENYDAYAVLLSLRLGQHDYSRAKALCDWRLERLPNCAYTLLNKLQVVGLVGNKADGKKILKVFHEQHQYYPILIQKADIIFHSQLGSNRRAFKLIAAARKNGHISMDWLDGYESDARNDSGHIFTNYKMSKDFLKENPNSISGLHSLAALSVLMGKLFPAIRYAKRFKELEPARAPAANEIIWVCRLGMLPIFWPAMIFLVINACFFARIPLLLRIPFNYLLFIFMLLLASLIVLPLSYLNESLYGTAVIVMMITTIGGIYYLMYGFQRIGNSLSNKSKSITISDNY